MKFARMAASATLLAILAGSAFGASSEVANHPPFPMITVTGEGAAALTPDLALVTAGVTSEARTARDAAEDNARASAAVLAAAKSAHIAVSDLRTGRFSIQPVYAPQSDGAPPRISGYRASNSVVVKLRDVARIGAVIDALIAAGATNIAGPEFTVADASTLLDQARAAAMADARRKAELLARAAGATLGRPVSIREGDDDPVHPFASLRAASASAPAGTPILAGEQDRRVRVTVSYELSR